MNSHLTRDFLARFRQLPENVKEKTRKNHRLWQQNPNHPSLRFKRVHTIEPIYSVRIGIEWRALGLREGNAIHWFWIGPHDEYDRLLRQF
ncbi:MAG: hypothetical protein OXH39_04865 [Candidatus Poribacteria bacterium]|nr:hypothetical protein [Candidatus Poribacteria bacterium]